MKKITGNVSVGSVDKMIEAVKEYRKWLERKTAEFVKRLSEEGVRIARAGFASASYDGDKDATVSVSVRDNGRAVVAIGSSVLFIEFGTGVSYPDDHPEAGINGMVRGGYGKGHGKQSKWGYYGSPGTNGEVIVNKSGREVVITKGNPANMPMYNTVKELKAMIERIAKEVYK